jgi:hypothetical protein
MEKAPDGEKRRAFVAPLFTAVCRVLGGTRKFLIRNRL